MDDPYLKESYKSYHKCQVANSARRNSLQKKTLGLENQRKLTNTKLNREEKLLREQLKSMKLELAKNSGSNGAKGATTSGSKSSKKESTESKPLDLVYVEPYPVTFAGHSTKITRQRSMTLLHSEGRRYAARKGRRQSKEFEDLNINTSTGQLAIPSYILNFQSKSPHSSGSVSPLSPRRGLNDSPLSSSSETVHWQGDPEAIQSVRRPRKSIGQQVKERASKIKGDLL